MTALESLSSCSTGEDKSCAYEIVMAKGCSEQELMDAAFMPIYEAAENLMKVHLNFSDFSDHSSK